MHSSSTVKHKKTKDNNRNEFSNQDFEKNASISDGISDQSDTTFNSWKKKKIQVIANTPLFNKKRFYDDGATSEEFQSSINTTCDNEIFEEEEEIISDGNLKSPNNNISHRDVPILNVDDLSSASSINTGDAGPFEEQDFVIKSDQSSQTKKERNAEKIKKKQSANTNSSSAFFMESESDTLAKYSESLKETPRECFSRMDSENSGGSKIYFNAEASDAPAVKRVKKKIDNLMSPHKIDSSITNRGIRVRYVDDKIESPRRRPKVAQIFIEGDTDPIEYPDESDSTRYGQLSNEKYPHNVTDSELSDIALVDFDVSKSKYMKSPVKDLFNNDLDYAFNENQIKHENDSLSSNSNSFQARDIELESDDDISNERYEEAQRKIQKYGIEDSENQDNGALFDIKIPDQDEEGKLLLDLKKNAIMLSSSSSQESEVADEDELEMLGEMVMNRGLPFLKLSDSESEGDPIDTNANPNENTENIELQNQFPNEDSSELPPIQYDPLLAPKSLTTPRTPRTPRTPNEPVYTGNLILTITVIEAINLPNTMPKIRLEPYVIFKLKGSKEFKRTKTCRYIHPKRGSATNKTPKTDPNVYTFDNQQIVFKIDPTQNNILTIKVRDEDKFSGDVDLSGYDFVLSNLNTNELSDGWFRLNSFKNNSKGGKLHVKFDIEREVKPEPPHTPRSPKTPKTPNSTQNSENSHHSLKKENDSGSDFSSISEGNEKRESNENSNSFFKSQDDNQVDSNLDTNSDFLNSPAGDQNVSSPSGSGVILNE